MNTNRALPPTTGPSRTYGDSAASMRAQQAVPMAPSPAPVAPPPAGGAGVPAAAPAPAGPPIDLYAATERPDEPITAGAPFGPGPGAATPPDTTAEQLRALYQTHPNEDLRALLEIIDTGGF